MAEVFPHAPITEALIEIRAQLPAGLTMSDLEDLHSKVKSGYPDKRTRKWIEGKFEFANAQAPFKSSAVQEDGYLFGSVDGKQVAQFRLDGFTFNRLRPYSRWQDFSQEARRLWEIYRDAVKPVLVTQIGVRYINSIEIPGKTFDYDDYFTAVPKIPPPLPQLIQNFFSRVVIPFPDLGAVATVIQTPSGKQDPVHTDILLDIDVVSDSNLGPDDRRIWEVFGNLRNIKNEVFFSHIKDKTKELFG